MICAPNANVTGDEASEVLDLAQAAVAVAESIGQSVVTKSGGTGSSGKDGRCLPSFCTLTDCVFDSAVGNLHGIEDMLHQFAMSVARAVWNVGEAENTIKSFLQMHRDRQRAVDFKKAQMGAHRGTKCC